MTAKQTERPNGIRIAWLPPVPTKKIRVNSAVPYMVDGVLHVRVFKTPAEATAFRKMKGAVNNG